MCSVLNFHLVNFLLHRYCTTKFPFFLTGTAYALTQYLTAAAALSWKIVKVNVEAHQCLDINQEQGDTVNEQNQLKSLFGHILLKLPSFII